MQPVITPRLRNIHKLMMRRCYRANDFNYVDYGGRGITVTPDWHDVTMFTEWAHANGYAPHLTIERDDNDVGYGPSNCRWATVAEQAQNRRTTKLTWDDVHTIRSRSIAGDRTSHIARDYAVTRQMVEKIISGRSWKQAL